MEDADIQSKPVTVEQGELFSTLPNEILMKVFGYLEIYDVMNLNLVCKRWQRLSDSDALWGNFVPKYPGVDLPKAKTQKNVFKKLWCDSVKIGKERWFPNALPDFVQYNTLLQKHNEEHIAGHTGDFFSLSKCMLYLRLNPIYPFTTNEIKHEGPLMREIVHKISDKRGNISRLDDEAPKVRNAASPILMNSMGNRKHAMSVILQTCYDFQTSEEIVDMGEELLDDEGHILEAENINDHEKIGGAFTVKEGMNLSKKLYNQIRNIVVDKSNEFIVYIVQTRNENEELPYPRQILVSDTAVVYSARRVYWVPN